jgi:phage tail sheath protein FI
MSPTSYATPGVYVEEVSTLPPSIAEVGTAIPAFIGTTTIAGDKDQIIVKQVSSLREYEEQFGAPPAASWRAVYNPSLDEFSLQDNEGNPVDQYSLPAGMLWYSLDLYFRNGGSRCYIVSVGKSPARGKNVMAKAYLDGLEKLESFDEPTLILIPEATTLSDADYGNICSAALAHAAKMRDRFVVLDAKLPQMNQPSTDDLTKMRGMLTGSKDNLSRGAIYYPNLLTTFPHVYSEAAIRVMNIPAQASNAEKAGALASETGDKSATSGSSAARKGTETPAITLDQLANTQTGYYNKIRKLLNEQRVILPASPGVAGVIASTDRERGVWKAPANEALQSVISPSLQLTDESQSQLNLDADSGKSINAIRSFTGKGTLVWGARTLAGNDNEWRYISVRRLFITVEESVKKATSFAVFEPNDSSTWLKVKGMIDSFLYSLWERGALQGSKAEEAYFVNIGLNKTMSSADILNGLLIVEIGLAAVRPAEFVILRFSHKLAQ